LYAVGSRYRWNAERERKREKEREKEKGNKNGNDAQDIIDRLNRRSFARLLFEK